MTIVLASDENTGIIQSMNSHHGTLVPQILPIGANRVVLLDASLQPSLESLVKIAPNDLLSRMPAMASAVKKREWILSRMLMSEVLGDIPGTGPLGEPQWQDGQVTSLSHKCGHVALAYGAQGDASAFGIDLEARRDLDPGVVQKIMTHHELQQVSGLDSNVTSAVFSAKESIYKCLFYRVGRVFYFEAVELVDFVMIHDVGVMLFRTSRELSELVPADKLIRVDVRLVRLEQADYWLTFARG